MSNNNEDDDFIVTTIDDSVKQTPSPKQDKKGASKMAQSSPATKGVQPSDTGDGEFDIMMQPKDEQKEAKSL